MKIKKIKLLDEYIYPATIAAAVKDANFLKESGSPMTQGEINTSLSENKVDKVTGKSLVDDIEISKLVDLPNKTTLDSAIADAKKTGTDAQNSLSKHTLNTTNPHNVTKEQVGLGSVDNTSDIDKPISTKTQTALDTKVDKETGKGLSTNDFTDDLLEKLNGIESGAQVNTVTGVKGNAETTYRRGDINITPDNVGAVALTEKGAASGVVPLNDQKLIDAKYLPSYVDDVEEYAGKDNFPITGESGKIYVDTTVEENNTYRWSGSTYILIAKNTNTTYTLSKDGSTIKLTGNDGSVTTVEDDNTTYSNATLTVSGLMSSTDKSKLDGIATNANNYSLPTANSSTLGGVKIGDNINNNNGTISVAVDSSLSDTSTNPVQNKVINNSINSINSSISSISSTIAEMACVYGVRHYYNNSSTALTRIGSSNLHVTLPVQSRMRRCVVADDGSVVYYLDANDSTKKEDGTAAVLDGTDGLVMVEVPEHYRRHTLGSDYYDSEIALVPFTGAFKVNKYYVSMSEAAMDRTNNKLSSVVNTTTQYRGGNNTSSWDDTYRSLLGMPATSISTINFHTYANNRGTGWEMYEVDVHDDIYWLYVIEYANTNVLLAYNSELTSEGYHQGGLGPGVTVLPSGNWSSYNSYNPVVPCGATLSLGNNSGVVAYTVLASDGTSTAATELVPSYRGIQNPYAHIWQWAIGYMGVGNGTNQVAYRCRHRKHYSTGSLNNYYSQVGLISSSGGWTKTIVKNKYGDIIPTSVGAGDTTYFSDYLWEAHSNGSIYAYLFSGGLDNGSNCGLGCLPLNNGFASAYAHHGSRLVYCASDYIVE